MCYSDNTSSNGNSNKTGPPRPPTKPTGPAEPGALPPIPTHPACAAALAEARSRLSPSIFNHSFRVYLYAQRLLQQEQQEPEQRRYQVPHENLSPFAPAVNTNNVLLFIACILHDIGTAASLASHPQRFDVAGADFAVALLRRYGFGVGVDVGADDAGALDLRECWLAIALHSSPQIAEGAGGLVALLRRAVLFDFGGGEDGSIPVVAAAVNSQPPTAPSQHVVTSSNSGSSTTYCLDRTFKKEVERQFPRFNVEKELGDAVVSQAEANSNKAPGGSWPGDLLRAAREAPEWEGVNKAF